MGKSTPKKRPRKTKSWTVAGFVIERPTRDFPLSPHSSGKWQKKIHGETVYFGTWAKRVDGKLKRIEGDGWQDALATYNRQADALHAGRTPRASTDSITVAKLCNRFLTSKLRKVEAVELSSRAFKEYREATDLIVTAFGKTRLVDDLAADDFESLRARMAKRWGPARLGKFVQLVRSTFKYAAENALIDRPVLFGSAFTKPGKATMRKHKAASDKKLFTADELRTILAALAGDEAAAALDKRTGKPATKTPPANLQLRAAVLLGINCGLGNTDVSGLEKRHLKLGWLDYPRPKSGLPRRCPLWAETIDAIGEAAKVRPKAKSTDDANCIFLNRAGRRLVQSTATSASDYVSTQFRQLLCKLKINGRRGLGFYSIRHTFATIGLQTADRDAVRFLMGHAAHDVLASYDETGPSDQRLRAVVEYVHAWLFEGTNEG